MKAEAHIKKLLDEATTIALAELEKRVRTVLRAGAKGRNPARSFCMAMGAASFYDKDGEPLTADFDQKWRWADPTYNFLSEFDDALHLTGCPMRIDGPDEPVQEGW